jgi:hypothetical protein
VTSTLVAALVATGLRLVASHAYADGAPPGFAGGFKEESCHACHFHAEPNAPPGRVAIEGVPDRFAAGQRYTLTIALTRGEMKRAGFQLTARFKDGGAQAGALARPADDAGRIKIDTHGGIQYANQTRSGSAVETGAVARWTVDWVAPAAGGTVTFHVSANAADGNDSADGDFIYTAAVDASPSQ